MRFDSDFTQISEPKAVWSFSENKSFGNPIVPTKEHFVLANFDKNLGLGQTPAPPRYDKIPSFDEKNYGSPLIIFAHGEFH